MGPGVLRVLPLLCSWNLGAHRREEPREQRLPQPKGSALPTPAEVKHL